MLDQIGFRNGRKDLSALDQIPFLYEQRNVPACLFIQRRDIAAGGDERSGLSGNLFQRPFDAVKDVAQDARPQRYGNRLARSLDRFSRP